MGELLLMISTEATWEGGEVSTLRLLCTARQCISIDLTKGHLTAPEDTCPRGLLHRNERTLERWWQCDANRGARNAD